MTRKCREMIANAPPLPEKRKRSPSSESPPYSTEKTLWTSVLVARRRWLNGGAPMTAAEQTSYAAGIVAKLIRRAAAKKAWIFRPQLTPCKGTLAFRKKHADYQRAWRVARQIRSACGLLLTPQSSLVDWRDLSKYVLCAEAV